MGPKRLTKYRIRKLVELPDIDLENRVARTLDVAQKKKWRTVRFVLGSVRWRGGETAFELVEMFERSVNCRPIKRRAI